MWQKKRKVWLRRNSVFLSLPFSKVINTMIGEQIERKEKTFLRRKNTQKHILIISILFINRNRKEMNDLEICLLYPPATVLPFCCKRAKRRREFIEIKRKGREYFLAIVIWNFFLKRVISLALSLIGFSFTITLWWELSEII